MTAFKAKPFIKKTSMDCMTFKRDSEGNMSTKFHDGTEAITPTGASPDMEDGFAGQVPAILNTGANVGFL